MSVWHIEQHILRHSKPCSTQFRSPLPIPDFHRRSEECQVQLQYQLSGIGFRSKRSSEKSEIHTLTSNHTKKPRSNPPPSTGSCNGSGRIPLWTTVIWANPGKLQRRAAYSVDYKQCLNGERKTRQP